MRLPFYSGMARSVDSSLNYSVILKAGNLKFWMQVSGSKCSPETSRKLKIFVPHNGILYHLLWLVTAPGFSPRVGSAHPIFGSNGKGSTCLSSQELGVRCVFIAYPIPKNITCFGIFLDALERWYQIKINIIVTWFDCFYDCSQTHQSLFQNLSRTNVLLLKQWDHWADRYS